MNISRKLWTAAAATLLVCGLAVPAMAAPVIDRTATGSVTVTKYQYNRKNFSQCTATGTAADAREDAEPLQGVEFTLYRVINTADTCRYFAGGDATEITADHFLVTENGQKVMDASKVLTGADRIVRTAPTDADGRIVFGDLPVGMYMLVETDASGAAYGNTVRNMAEPALISVPMVNTRGTGNAVSANENWMYDIAVFPKNETVGAAIRVQKTDNRGHGLEGVTFRLTRFTDAGYGTVDTDPATTYDLDAGTPDGISLGTTAADGSLTAFAGLPEGWYELAETAAPEGVIVDRSPVRFEVQSDSRIRCACSYPWVSLMDGSGAAVSSITGDCTLQVNLVNEAPALEKYVMADPAEGSFAEPIAAPWAAEYAGSFGKTAEYSLGETVYYRLDVYVPENIARMDTFRLVDTAEAVNPLAVLGIKYGDQNLIFSGAEPACQVSLADHSLTLDFVPERMPEGAAGETLHIYYAAELTGNAVIYGEGNLNRAVLTYDRSLPPVDRSASTDGSTPTDGNTPAGGNAPAGGEMPENMTELGTLTDEATVYTYAFDITKRRNRETGAVLKGVEFVLRYEKTGENLPLIFVEDGIYRLPTVSEIADETVAKATSLITPEDGHVEIRGLEPGTVYLKETKTLKGYNLPKKPFEIHITADGQTSETIINKKGFTLPQTGTMGPYLFWIVGGLVMLAGLIVIVGGKEKNH